MKLYHLIYLMLALILALGLLGCQETPDEPGDTDGPIGEPEDTDNPENGVTVSDLAAYTVVRTELGKEAEKKAAADLATLLRDSCGVAGIVTDYEAAVEKEILVGKTNRPESEAAYAWAETQVAEDEGWYYIGVSGNKIVLCGTGDDGTAAAVRYAMKEYGEKMKSGEVTLPEQQQLFTYQSGKPTLVTTEHGTSGNKSVFVATVHLGVAPHFLDSTGEEDVTATIRAALEQVGKLGGGVVYLPAGIYRITDTLTLPQNVTLRGEYVDPDQGDCTKGTVLLADAKKFPKTKNVLHMNQGALAQGLTVYYEGQKLDAVIEYAPTITCTPGNGSWELRDITLLNSYDGIANGDRPNGMVTLDNVKGTALHMGYEMQQRADISIATDISFSPKYWAAAGEKFNAPAEADIRKYMKSCGSIGFYFGDCDRDTYENILLDGFATGMYNREMTRAGLSGSYYNVQILDAKVGIEAYGIDTRYGLLMVDTTIKASDIAVKNGTVTDSKFCQIHLLNSEIEGETVGDVHVYASEQAKDTDYTPRSKNPALPGEKLFHLADYGVDATGKTDISEALQKALDDAAAAGGGIVYVPVGRYLLAKPVTISGDNVQLLGCNTGTHTQNGALDTASILLVTHGRGGDENAQAAITVSGANSGVTGFSVIYPENGVSHANFETESPEVYAYFMRATGKGSYINFTTLIAVSRAVHFDGADSFICDRLLMTVWDRGIRVTDCKGLISRIHTNGTYHTLGAGCLPVLGNDWAHNAAEVVVKVLDAHIVKRLQLITLENGADVQLLHVFHYGAVRYMDATESIAFVLNGESSRLTEMSFVLHGGCDLTVINFMRPNPSAYLEQEGENYAYLYNWGAAHYSGERIVVYEPQ